MSATSWNPNRNSRIHTVDDVLREGENTSTEARLKRLSEEVEKASEFITQRQEEGRRVEGDVKKYMDERRAHSRAVWERSGGSLQDSCDLMEIPRAGDDANADPNVRFNRLLDSMQAKAVENTKETKRLLEECRTQKIPSVLSTFATAFISVFSWIKEKLCMIFKCLGFK